MKSILRKTKTFKRKSKKSNKKIVFGRTTYVSIPRVPGTVPYNSPVKKTIKSTVKKTG
jgi:dihydrofolate reductase